jgi:hypothetical protein
MKIRKPSDVFPHTYNPLTAVAIGALVLAAGTSALHAQPIAVSNYSFESQVVNPVIFPIDTRVDSWQRTPQPGWFVPSPQLTWDQTVGMFNGTLQNPYSNLVGNQAAYMLPIPSAGIFQDNLSVDWNGTVGGLNATYQPGLAYQFTLGVFGKSMIEGYSSMQLSLYYRDGANMVTVGTPTTITFSTSTFNPGGPFTLVDSSVTTPIVQAGDAWAGKNIGIKIESLLGDGNGYWDMDNARLTAVVPEPTALGLVALGLGGFLFARVRSGRKA